jgi:hypothetical protein
MPKLFRSGEMNVVNVNSVSYLGDYVLKINFSDGHTQKISFKSFICASNHPDIEKYKDEMLFRQFLVTEGDLEWNDYEMCFPVEDLYENKNIEVLANNAA